MVLEELASTNLLLQLTSIVDRHLLFLDWFVEVRNQICLRISVYFDYLGFVGPRKFRGVKSVEDTSPTTSLRGSFELGRYETFESSLAGGLRLWDLKLTLHCSYN